MKKLFVAGCSYSDHTKVDKVYGEFLSEMLGYEYVHCGVGAGSNYKIWRTITKHILDKNLTEQDLLIVQYTEITREEIWTNLLSSNGAIRHIYNIDGGCVTDWKFFSHEWQLNKIVCQFHLLKEKHFTSKVFSEEKFITNNHMFQTMLKYNNIPTIFLNANRIVPMECNLHKQCIPEYLPYIFDDAETEILNPKYNLSPSDKAHLSDEGHELYAKLLFEHIKNKMKFLLI